MAKKQKAKKKSIGELRADLVHYEEQRRITTELLRAAQLAELPFGVGDVIEGKISHVYRGGDTWRPVKVTHIKFDGWRGTEVRGVFQLKKDGVWGVKVWSLIDWRMPETTAEVSE